MCYPVFLTSLIKSILLQLPPQLNLLAPMLPPIRKCVRIPFQPFVSKNIPNLPYAFYRRRLQDVEPP